MQKIFIVQTGEFTKGWNKGEKVVAKKIPYATSHLFFVLIFISK